MRTNISVRRNKALAIYIASITLFVVTYTAITASIYL